MSVAQQLAGRADPPDFAPCSNADSDSATDIYDEDDGDGDGGAGVSSSDSNDNDAGRDSDPTVEAVVEAIRRSRRRDSKTEYLVKWAGYAESENTWEPAVNLHEELVADFDAADAEFKVAKTDARQLRETEGISMTDAKGSGCLETAGPPPPESEIEPSEVADCTAMLALAATRAQCWPDGDTSAARDSARSDFEYNFWRAIDEIAEDSNDSRELAKSHGHLSTDFDSLQKYSRFISNEARLSPFHCNHLAMLISSPDGASQNSPAGRACTHAVHQALLKHLEFNDHRFGTRRRSR